MAQPKTIDFYRSTRPVQDRFVAATSRSSPPTPLLFQSAPRTRAWVMLGASVVALLVATLFLVAGWGDASSPLALHQRPILAVDVALFSVAAYCFVHAAAIIRSMEALPYRPGIYLFPACVVDATGPVLRVWPTGAFDAVERLPDPALALRAPDGQRVVVGALRPADVERADAALTNLRPELARAIAEENIDVLAELDPLHPTNVSSPISSNQPLARFAPLWIRFDWLLALAVGTALGVGLGAMRNSTSDDRMYRTVAGSGNVVLLRDYLARGGAHADEVRDVLLPRAELRQAQLHGNVDVLQQFARDHASSQIQPEIAAAMRQALLAELEKAKAVGTVTAIDEFARKYPDHVVDAEIHAARHALYAKALAAARAKGRMEPAAASFAERLLAAAEAAGPACEVRFRRRESKTLDDADRRIAKNVNFPGSDAFPSHYFTPEVMGPREQRVAQAVVDGFASEFPADILAPRVGETLPADAAPPAGVPLLLVDYAPEWSGLDTLSLKPKTIIAGVRFDFDVHFTLRRPEDGAPYTLAVKSMRGPEIWKLKNTNVPLTEFEQKVYEQVIDRSFDDLQKRLTDAFFRGSS